MTRSFHRNMWVVIASFFTYTFGKLVEKNRKIFDKTNTVQIGATGITEACIPFLPLPSNFQKR